MNYKNRSVLRAIIDPTDHVSDPIDQGTDPIDQMIAPIDRTTAPADRFSRFYRLRNDGTSKEPPSIAVQHTVLSVFISPLSYLASLVLVGRTEPPA